jgi:predicted nucleic acid-binding protein
MRSRRRHVWVLHDSERTSIDSSTRIRRLVAEHRRGRGLIDTSVLIDLGLIDPETLPDEMAISAVSVAELAAGPHATSDPAERARRQDRLQRVEATFEPLPVDADVARAYGRVYAAVAATGRKARGRRTIDLFIAATAVAHGLPIYTRNPADFAGLSDLVEIITI